MKFDFRKRRKKNKEKNRRIKESPSNKYSSSYLYDCNKKLVTFRSAIKISFSIDKQTGLQT